MPRSVRKLAMQVWRNPQQLEIGENRFENTKKPVSSDSSPDSNVYIYILFLFRFLKNVVYINCAITFYLLLFICLTIWFVKLRVYWCFLFSSLLKKLFKSVPPFIIFPYGGCSISYYFFSLEDVQPLIIFPYGGCSTTYYFSFWRMFNIL